MRTNEDGLASTDRRCRSESTALLYVLSRGSIYCSSGSKPQGAQKRHVCFEEDRSTIIRFLLLQSPKLLSHTTFTMGSMAELPEKFTIDVHTHAIPTIWKEEIIKAGYKAEGTQPFIDGFLTPEWDIDMYMRNREEFGYDYSVMSIGTPGVNFLEGQTATELARTINNEMAGYVKKHPTRLGAMALLPFPNLEDCITEVKVSPFP